MSENKVEALIVELCNQRDSSFVLDGSVESGAPIRLRFPSKAFIPVESVTMYDKNGNKTSKRHKIRFIKGAGTIYVEEQKEQGIEPNPQADVIVIENGRHELNREGIDADLFDYLKLCEFNKKHEGDFPNAHPLFYELDIHAETEDEMQTLELDAEVLAVIASLRDKEGDKFVYEEATIDNYVGLLNLEVGGLTYPEKLRSLRAWALGNPSKFIAMVSAKETKLRKLIQQALEHQLIVIDEDGVKHSDDGNVLFSTKSTDPSKQKDEFIEYLTSADGSEKLAFLENIVEKATSDGAAMV